MNEIEYKFEDLPLIVDGEIVAGLLGGTATIRYGDDDWWVSGIALDGYGPKPGQHQGVDIEQRYYPQLYATICNRLELEPFGPGIEEAIASDMIENGTSYAPDWQQHSTLNHAQQGIG